MGDLQGRRCLLSGASRGIGAEIVKRFTAEGAELIGTARDQQRLQALAAEYGPRFSFVAGDVTDPVLCARLAEAVEKRWGALDILINNAAILTWNEGFHSESVDTLEKTLRANLLSVHWLICALLPLLKRGSEPRILNISSGAGKFKALQEDPSMPSYRLSKYALGGLTLLYAGDLKGRVDINCLDPGWLRTDMGGLQAPGKPEEGAERALAVVLKPWGTTGKFWHGAQEIEF